MILWDGGNNDTPFIRPDLHIVVVDPHRPGHELRYHPGETNLRMADVCVVNKVDSATQEGIDAVLDSIRDAQPGREGRARQLPVPRRGRRRARSRGKRVLAIEDGPTLTHGEMTYGAAVLAAKAERRRRARRPAPVRRRLDRRDLRASTRTSARSAGDGLRARADGGPRETIERCDADLVLIGTPIDLRRLIDFDRPALRVTYRLQEIGEPTLADVLAEHGLIGEHAALV